MSGPETFSNWRRQKLIKWKKNKKKNTHSQSFNSVKHIVVTLFFFFFLHSVTYTSEYHFLIFCPQRMNLHNVTLLSKVWNSVKAEKVTDLSKLSTRCWSCLFSSSSTLFLCLKSSIWLPWVSTYHNIRQVLYWMTWTATCKCKYLNSSYSFLIPVEITHIFLKGDKQHKQTISA